MIPNLRQDDFFKVSVYSYAFTLPLSLLANNITAIAIVLSHILFRFTTKYSQLKLDWLLVFPIATYLLDTLSLLYTINLLDGVFELEKKLLLLLFPLIALFDPRFKSKIDLNVVMNLFSLSIIFVCIVCHSLAIADIIIKGLPASEFLDYEYSGHELFRPFSLHATYIGVYLLLVAYHLYNCLTSEERFFRKVILIIILVYIVFCIFHTSSRVVFISFLILISLLIYRKLYKLPVAVRITSISLSLFLIATASFYFLPFLAYKFIWIKELIYLPKSTDINKLEYLRNERAYLWPAAFDLIMKSPFVGYGPGDVLDQLVQLYNDKGYTHWAEGRYNVHSQYLHTWLGTGLFGLLLLISLLVMSIVKGLNRSDYLLVLTILVSVVCITEVFFGLHQGIAFFAFFYVLFVKNGHK